MKLTLVFVLGLILYVESSVIPIASGYAVYPAYTNIIASAPHIPATIAIAPAHTIVAAVPPSHIPAAVSIYESPPPTPAPISEEPAETPETPEPSEETTETPEPADGHAEHTHGISLETSPAHPVVIVGHHAVIASAPVVPIAVAEGTYVAKTRGTEHIASLPGHILSASSVNLEPAPGTS